MADSQTVGLKWPWLTLSICGLAVLGFACAPLAVGLEYQRQAILHGEWWRLLTAPLSHFSASHLAWNLLAFGAAGWVIEAHGYRGLWLICLATALGSGLLALWLLPDLAAYRGLSGLATGAIVYFCLRRLAESRRDRVLWLIILALLAGKIAYDLSTGQTLLATSAGEPLRVLGLAHLVGAVTGVAVAVWARRSQHRRQSRVTPDPLAQLSPEPKG